MSINSIGNNPQVQRIVSQPVQRSVSPAGPNQTSVTDKVELSGVGHLMKALQTNDIRTDKVAEIRAQIANGNYEDDRKLDVAIDRLLDELV